AEAQFARAADRESILFAPGALPFHHDLAGLREGFLDPDRGEVRESPFYLYLTN
ncbi:unnamed protein product, partial [Amoebophrya sp. A120]